MGLPSIDAFARDPRAICPDGSEEEHAGVGEWVVRRHAWQDDLAGAFEYRATRLPLSSTSQYLVDAVPRLEPVKAASRGECPRTARRGPRSRLGIGRCGHLS